MTEKEINRMIDTEAMARRNEDNRHLEGLLSEMTADLQPWCARRRRMHTLLAVGVLLVVPTLYGLLLPTGATAQVVCNQAGGDEAVLCCAKQILTKI